MSRAGNAGKTLNWKRLLVTLAIGAVPTVIFFLKESAFLKNDFLTVETEWCGEISGESGSAVLLPRIRSKSFSVEEISSFLTKFTPRF